MPLHNSLIPNSIFVYPPSPPAQVPALPPLDDLHQVGQCDGQAKSAGEEDPGKDQPPKPEEGKAQMI